MSETAASAAAMPAGVATDDSTVASDGNVSPRPEVAPELPDLLEIQVPKGARTVLVSDLHIPCETTETSKRLVTDLCKVLDQWVGPGVFVIAGDGFELLAGPPDIGLILDAHPRLVGSLATFAATPGRTLVILPGNHDGRLAWDADARALLRERLGTYSMAFSVDLMIMTEHGCQRVHVVHGNQLDPYNTFEDPRSPVDTPFGHHVVQLLLPRLQERQTPGSLLDGIQWLDGDPAEFLGSRLLYRKVVGKLWLFAIPFVAALVLRFLAFLPGLGGVLHHHVERWMIGAGTLIILMVVVAVIAALVTMLRVNRSLRTSALSDRTDPHTHNSAARAEASRLVTEGYAGMVSGHTHEPELAVVGNGFYANTGSGTESVVPRPSRLRLPRPFVAVRRLCYVEIHGAGVLEVHLYLAERESRRPSVLERLAHARSRSRGVGLTCVASLPEGPTWPLDHGVLTGSLRRRRVRRLAAALLLVFGLGNAVLALVWSVPSSLERWLPIGIHPLSGTAAVVGGLALVGVSRGVRYGFRGAWLAAIVVLLACTVNRLVQGHGLEGAAFDFLLALWLLAEHRHFTVALSGVSRYVSWLLAVGLVAAVAVVFIDASFVTTHDEVLDVVLFAVFGVLLVGTLIALPGRDTRLTGKARRAAFERTRAIVEKHGGATFDYFALRDDKSWFFTGNTVAAYSVIEGVMLVAPDPIGPIDERATAWADTMDFCQSRGWELSVLAASVAWLPIYRAAGLVDHYVGNEAVVDCLTFSLTGKSMKALRDSYEDAKGAGYRVEVLDPLEAPPTLRRAVLDLMTETEGEEMEHGYWLTLSRLFDPRDPGLLLAVCFDPEGQPVAFNQYVPAPLVEGYSLDTTRRKPEPEAPAGVDDFLIIETIEWMAEHGLRGLGLNFAIRSEAVADEEREGPWVSMQETTLHHFDDTRQIESLREFNKKYDPEWFPRYVITGPHLRGARRGLAIARAEALGRLPLVGRFLRPKEPAHSR
jgi:lysylphosphatidylglycerol synthetase-like protein (DUF2156 family)/UDP-2,3-diacylglucosamine pyrophosphatase LpxH